jgi:hypothetical protein
LQALSCAAIDDVLAWCVLALASSFAKSGSALMGLYTTLLAAAYVLFMMVVLRPILVLLHRFLVRKQLESSRYYLALLFILMLASAFTTEGLGIHCFFGGFVMGLIVPKDGGFADSLVTRMELVVGEYLQRRGALGVHWVLVEHFQWPCCCFVVVVYELLVLKVQWCCGQSCPQAGTCTFTPATAPQSS